MRRFRRVGLQAYRGHKLELLDDRHEGWAVAIHPPGSTDKVVLRNHVPGGLETLVAEAKRQVDRRLDGSRDDRAG